MALPAILSGIAGLLPGLEVKVVKVVEANNGLELTYTEVSAEKESAEKESAGTYSLRGGLGGEGADVVRAMLLNYLASRVMQCARLPQNTNVVPMLDDYKSVHDALGQQLSNFALQGAPSAPVAALAPGRGVQRAEDKIQEMPPAAVPPAPPAAPRSIAAVQASPELHARIKKIQTWIQTDGNDIELQNKPDLEALLKLDSDNAINQYILEIGEEKAKHAVIDLESIIEDFQRYSTKKTATRTSRNSQIQPLVLRINQMEKDARYAAAMQQFTTKYAANLNKWTSGNNQDTDETARIVHAMNLELDKLQQDALTPPARSEPSDWSMSAPTENPVVGQINRLQAQISKMENDPKYANAMRSYKFKHDNVLRGWKSTLDDVLNTQEDVVSDMQNELDKIKSNANSAKKPYDYDRFF